MILLYHKVYKESPTVWWVDVDNFYRQMSELRCKDIVYLDNYDHNNPNHCVITFDGVYKNVLEYAAPILHKFGYPFELFITGNYLNSDNSFDHPEPPAYFVSPDELKKLIRLGGRIQWHTKTHADLTTIQERDILVNELVVPNELKTIDKNGFKWIAYPHGNFNEFVKNSSKDFFSGCVSCHQGNDQDIYALNRITVTNKTSFRDQKIVVIIPCFNYGHFLSEAIDSVLRQTIPVNEILIADDCSSDNTYEIGNEYARLYPALIRYHRNERNLGIVNNFNQAVSMTTAEYICFLGADNRFLSNYIEECSQVLDSADDIAIAYTDCALFGTRANIVYDQYPPSFRGRVFQNQIFYTNFPEFDNYSLSELKLNNCIHGSSMFKRSAYNMIGGYKSNLKLPEDHDLFLRMLLKGWKAKKATTTFLEYRQHSINQANVTLQSYHELLFYKRKVKQLEQKLKNLERNPFAKYYKTFFFQLIRGAIKSLKEQGIKITLKRIQNYAKKYIHRRSA
jgi:glycosyltransferase involved in cell wall biosynthesis